MPKLVQTMLTAKENISQDKKISNNLKKKWFFVHTEPEALKNAYHKYNDPSRWEAEGVGDPNKRPMSMTNIIANVRHDLGLNIIHGYVRAKNAKIDTEVFDSD